MKVYVITKAHLFGEEKYVGIASSFKKAEKLLREQFPYMRKDKLANGHCYYSDNSDHRQLLFIKEEEI